MLRSRHCYGWSTSSAKANSTRSLARSQEVTAMAQDTEAGRRPGAPDRNNVGPPAIVVGLDGSPSSWDAFSWAAGEALRINGKVVAVYVIPLTDAAAAFGVPFY